MSELKVNKVSPQSGTDFTLGDSGDTFTVPSGATLTVAGTFTQTGAQTFDGGVDIDNFNINGTTITLSSGDMTLDVAGDIVLDADGGDVFVKDAGTTFGSLTNTSGNLIIKSGTTTAATFSGANVTLAGTVDSGAITSTGIVTGTGFTAGSAVLAEAELELLDGLTAGTAIASKVVTTDANIDTTGQRNLTITGELDAATGDFSGDVDIDGTLEADAITVDGTTLAEFISDTTGAMFSSNTETGITATYQDSDNTIDLALAAAQTTITSLLATDIKIGEDNETKIDFETADEIHFYSANAEQVYVADGIFGPQTDSDVDLGSTGVRWKDAFVDSLTTTGDLTIGGNFTVNGTTTTVATTNMVVADNLIELNNGASSNSNDSGIVIERGSTGDNAIFVWDESADTFVLGTTTATGSSTGNLTIADGALQAGSLDISGNIDVDGTTNLDVVDIDGAVDMASTLQVDGAITSSDGMTITTADNTETLILKSTDADAAVGPLLVLRRDSSSPADNDLLGEIQMEVENSNGSKLDAVTLTGKVLDVTAGTVDGSLAINIISGSTLTEFAKFEGSVGSTFSQPVSITSADNLAQLTLKSTDADASAGPLLVFHRDSSSPANNDFIGNIQFEMENDAGEQLDAVSILGKISDVADGTEDAEVQFFVRTAGSMVDRFAITRTEVSFNDGSIDSNFRVESNGNANMLFVDGGNDAIGIGTSAPDGQLHIVGSDTSDQVIIENTDGGVSSAPDLVLFRNSASPADNDVLGRIDFRGDNDAGQSVNYMLMYATATDVSDGTEDVKLDFEGMKAGSNAKLLTLSSSEVVINEDSNDVDFRVESNGNSGMFHINAGSDHVSVGTDGDLGGVFNVSGETVMRTAGNSDTLTLKCTDADADVGPVLALARDSSSPADNDILGRIKFQADDDGGNVTNFFTIDTRMADASDGSEDFKTVFSGIVAGTERHVFTLGSTEAVFNDGSQDIDFRVETNAEANAFKIDGGSETAAFGVPVTFNDAANVAQEAITSSSNAVAWDATDKPNAYHITTENTTFSAPSNAVEGAFICVEINYNGSHTIAWNTVFEFAGSTAPTTTDTDGKTDILVFRYNGAVWQEVGRTLNLSES